jgi:hypothetical protein
VVIDVGGIPFVAEQHLRHLLPGLRIEVQAVFGREGLVAYNSAFEPGGC